MKLWAMASETVRIDNSAQQGQLASLSSHGVDDYGSRSLQ